MRAKIGDVNIAFEVHGDAGPWVLLVQGLGYPRWGWSWQVDDLAREFRVISYDNRGIGESDKPPGPYTVAEMAGDGIGVLDELGVERAHVVGHSLGGFIAQEIAITFPDRVDRLVLGCTHFGGSDVYPMPQVTIDLMTTAASLPEDERLRRFIENAFTDEFVAAHPEVIDDILARRKQTAQPVEAWQAQAAASLSFEAKDRVQGIGAETLVVTGTEDRVVDPRNAAVLAAAIPNATALELPGGHLFAIERQKEFNDLVIRFLKEGIAGVDDWRAQSVGSGR